MLVSEIFPAWFLGRNPVDFVIDTSYSDALARTFSERAREHFRTFNGTLWDVGVSRSSASKSRWTIQQYGGGYIAAGAGGPISGFGARVAIIDDPVKNWQQAQSVTVRDTIWDWFRSTLRTRLTPDGAIILITTRWHSDDLVGRAIQAMNEGGEDADQWEILNLPAVAEENDILGRKPGDPLWPERYGSEFLRKTQVALGPSIWMALFQGRPHHKEGAMFNVDKVHVHQSIDEFPDGLHWARVWDYAHTEKQRASDDPDYTSGTLLAFKREEVTGGAVRFSLWIKDVWRCREAAPVRDTGIRRIMAQDGVYVRVGVEDSIDSRDGYESMRTMVGNQYNLERITLKGDKVVRATPLEAIFDSGDVHILAGAWNQAWFAELADFPFSAHDDQVDNLSAGYRMMALGPAVQRVRMM
jgi:predicted phage terminase large subunit-like protein